MISLLVLMVLFGGGSFGMKMDDISPDDFDSLSGLLDMSQVFSDAENADFVFLLDVSRDSQAYLKQAVNLTMSASKCFKLMQDTDNRVSMVTYYDKKAKTVLNFQDQVTDQTLRQAYAKIINESHSGSKTSMKSLKTAMRHAKHLLNGMKEDKTREKIVFVISTSLQSGKLKDMKKIVKKFSKVAVIAICKGADDVKVTETILDTLKSNQTDIWTSYVTDDSNFTIQMLKMAVETMC